MGSLVDSTGLYGIVLDYVVIFLLSGAAATLFVYLAIRGKLGFEEENKYTVFMSDQESSHE